MKTNRLSSALKSVFHIKSKKNSGSSVEIDFSRYRNNPNVAPFTIDLSPRTFKDSDAFIKQDSKNIEYARKVNYRYEKG